MKYAYINVTTEEGELIERIPVSAEDLSSTVNRHNLLVDVNKACRLALKKQGVEVKCKS